ncbi:MAG: hypothetical protein ACREMU_08975 [Gemmatimonadaceae bacterium]
MSLLAKEFHAIEHLLRSRTCRVQALAKALILALELRRATGELDARRAALASFELFQTRLGRLRAFAKAGELVAQALQQHFQLGYSAVFTQFGV